jgi:hypothetical protein
VREFLTRVPNLQLVGRNGQHRYNNQDHSMLAGLLAARNIMGAKFNLWDLNTDQDFHEEGVSITDEELMGMQASQPLAPELTRPDVTARIQDLALDAKPWMRIGEQSAFAIDLLEDGSSVARNCQTVSAL